MRMDIIGAAPELGGHPLSEPGTFPSSVDSSTGDTTYRQSKRDTGDFVPVEVSTLASPHVAVSTDPTGKTIENTPGGGKGTKSLPPQELGFVLTSSAKGRLLDYQLGSQLGDGAYGTVLLAEHIKTGETVAVKRMKNTYVTWKDALKEMEIVVAGELQRHPNIIHMIEAFRESEQLYMVFEYMECNLYQLMKERSTKRFIETEVRSISSQIFRGLQYLHEKEVFRTYSSPGSETWRGVFETTRLTSRGFFHRDLKPENILCNGTEVVKLADFGQARSIRSRPPYSEYVSTRWYRAPELVLSSRLYSVGVDIWAVGCIVAEIVMFRPLFDGASAADQLFKIIKILGSPTKEEWSQGYQLAEKMKMALPQGFERQKLGNIVKPCSQACVDVVAATLMYNPQKRPSARICLSMEFFGATGVEKKELAGDVSTSRSREPLRKTGASVLNQPKASLPLQKPSVPPMPLPTPIETSGAEIGKSPSTPSITPSFTPASTQRSLLSRNKSPNGKSENASIELAAYPGRSDPVFPSSALSVDAAASAFAVVSRTMPLRPFKPVNMPIMPATSGSQWNKDGSSSISGSLRNVPSKSGNVRSLLSTKQIGDIQSLLPADTKEARTILRYDEEWQGEISGISPLSKISVRSSPEFFFTTSPRKISGEEFKSRFKLNGVSLPRNSRITERKPLSKKRNVSPLSRNSVDVSLFKLGTSSPVEAKPTTFRHSAFRTRLSAPNLTPDHTTDVEGSISPFREPDGSIMPKSTFNGNNHPPSKNPPALSPLPFSLRGTKANPIPQTTTANFTEVIRNEFSRTTPGQNGSRKISLLNKTVVDRPVKLSVSGAHPDIGPTPKFSRQIDANPRFPPKRSQAQIANGMKQHFPLRQSQEPTWWEK